MANDHELHTGPIDAKLTCADGTVVDVTPLVIYLESHERALEVCELISQYYVTHGHPHVDGQFVYDGHTEMVVGKK